MNIEKMALEVMKGYLRYEYPDVYYPIVNTMGYRYYSRVYRHVNHMAAEGYI
jgi:hypothetical protein